MLHDVSTFILYILVINSQLRRRPSCTSPFSFFGSILLDSSSEAKAVEFLGEGLAMKAADLNLRFVGMDFDVTRLQAQLRYQVVGQRLSFTRVPSVSVTLQKFDLPSRSMNHTANGERPQSLHHC